MSDLPKRIVALPTKKYELLMRRLNRERAESAPPQLTPQPRDTNTFPLSFAQQRLWFLNQLAPDSAAYHIAVALRLSGPLDLPGLKRSLGRTMRRHEILRTTFAVIDGQPMQVISSVARLPLTVVSLQALAEHERAAHVAQLAITQAQAPFDLARDTLVRASLLRLSATEHVLLLTMHHIISDQWSMAIFLQEVTALYSADRAGREAALPDLPIQYADFACWQRRWLQGAVLQSQLDYWRGQLADAPDLLLLPTDRPRPPVQTSRGAVRALALPASITEGLMALSQREGTTLFMSLLAAFMVLLARYTEHEDLVVGSPIAGRTHAETEHLIGFFVNTLALRTKLSGNPTFRELLNRVREVALAAYTHQDLPFEQLVEALRPKRNLSYTPLFQVAFALQNVRRPPTELVGLTLQSLAFPITTAKFDLTLELAESPHGLAARLEYNTDLFDDTSMTRMLDHYQRVLEGVLADSDRRLTNVRLLSLAEEQQLLVEWNATQVAYPAEVCMHMLVQQQAVATPDAIALTDGSAHLTYSALTRRAVQLARHLRNHGVGPEVCVALCLPRSFDLVIGMLGVLFAGGAYVPLDPASPPDRLAFMCDDARAALLLTQQSIYDSRLTIDDLRESETTIVNRQSKIVNLDTDWPQIAVAAPTPSSIGTVDSANLAYVIYTSGSTGKPKGVAISHAGLFNLVAWHQRNYRISAADRATQVAGVGFDAAGWELWPYLAIGVSVHLPDAALLTAPQSLQNWLIAQAITICFLPTPLAELVLPLAWPRAPALRYLLTGGDQLHRYPVAALPFTFLNHYGPTEVTVVTSVAAVAGGGAQAGTPPIGQPIANTQIYVLDRDLQPVPVGVAGEIYISGVGVARGYHGQPTATAERFVPHPFAGDKENSKLLVSLSPCLADRLYRTGDLARYRADGDLEYLGRRDQQVKLRGLRIELGEIEAVLMQQAGVQAAAVLVQGMGAEDKRLIAYVAVESEQAPTVAALRAGLQARLPSYMVPAAFVLLDSLPLTPNGKIDRRALPALDPAQLSSDPALAMPRSPVEELLAQVWATVLRVERVGIYDNFFALGGHSLLATQLLAHVRQSLQVELPLRALFDAPTVAGMAAYLAQADDMAPASPPLVPRMHATPPPLSFAQQRLWFLDQLDPGGTMYLIPVAIRMRGALDVQALFASLNAVVRRHEALRTTFPMLNGHPVQQIAAFQPLPPIIIDLRALPAATRERLAQQLARDKLLQSFDLTAGPLVRVRLLRLGATDHVLLVTMHHIVSDGWSIGMLINEVSVGYAARLAGQTPALPVLPIQYADYAIWQRIWLQGAVLESQLAYWRAQLADLPILDLPTDHPRPSGGLAPSGRRTLRLPATLCAGLALLNRQEGITLFMMLLAAFQALLARYTGQDDIVVGTPIANRTRVETEHLIGFFVNTLVLRADLSGHPSVRDQLRQVRRVTLEAYGHQEVPFDRLVEELQPARRLSHTPLFQVMLVLQNTPQPTPVLAGLEVQLLGQQSGTAKFDLTLELVETDQGLSAGLEYRADLFEATSMARLLAQYQVLLEGCIANPEQPLALLPLLTSVEQQQLRVEWNATQATYPAKVCLPTLFARQVARTPDSLAVIYATAHLTYQELYRQANRLAHHLRAQGVGPTVLVGLCLERSPELIVGMLAILSAGGAYVPLDPASPPAHLALLIHTAGLPVVVTRRQHVPILPNDGLTTVCLDGDAPTIAQGRTSPPPVVQPASAPAYVIYTSGSTGTPKGVAVPHSAVTRLVWGTDYIQLSPTDRIAQGSTAVFDAATFEIWGALLHGATLIGLPREIVLVPERLATYLWTRAITVLFVTTALFNQVAQFAPTAFRTLHTLLFGGEAVAPEWVRAVLQQGAPRRLLHVYGPTESTTFATWQRVANVTDGALTIPIGRPIANTLGYVLDRDLQLVPVGVVGELYLGGEQLAWGYLNRPDLTAERFIPNPFAEVSGPRCRVSEDKLPDTRYPTPDTRLYKTGDLVRYRADGAIAFIGRRDDQVKLRGFRIEPAEIEAALGLHPAVRKCVVLARADGTSDRRLVAYVVPIQRSGVRDQRSGKAPVERLTPDPRTMIPELRTFLKERLPDYMMPAAFVLLESLPLTPNGKIDRRALPAPDPVQLALDPALAALRSPVEELLAQIWAAVLRVERVGIHDDFFALGGHSLLATQFLIRVRQVFQIELPLRVLFDAPTIAGMALAIEQARNSLVSIEQARNSLVSQDRGPIHRVPRDGQMPLSFAQERLWFLDQLQSGLPVYNVPIALRLAGPLNLAALAQSLNEIIRRHEALRTTFALLGDRPVQVITPELRIPLIVRDLSALAPASRYSQARSWALAEAQQPFDLGQGPLVRASLLRLEAQEHVLLLTQHHIVCDGWSIPILLEEMIVLYEAFLGGKSALLPDLPIQYADFAVWQRQWLQGTELEAQLDYWRKQLAGVAPALDLPTDRPRPTAQTYRGATYSIELPAPLSEALNALSRRADVTEFMLLLAAFQSLLHRYTRQDDLVVGSPIANRTRPETERLIGFFVNTLALRANMTGNPTFQELLVQVRSVCLGAYANQDIPFEKLVEELQPPRDLSRQPVFQVMLTFQVALPLVRVRSAPIMSPFVIGGGANAKFDLTLAIVKNAQRLHLSLEYSTDLFDAPIIVRLLRHFKRLLGGIAADPSRRLSDLPLLNVAEHAQILVEWNAPLPSTRRAASGFRSVPPDAGLPVSDSACIHTLFAAQVARTPDAVALVYQDMHLTYRQLARRANRLANYLQSIGVGPEVPVGICLERSPELIVGILGVLKAGGAYVPLDPAYPPERLAFMRDDSDVAVLITHQSIGDLRFTTDDLGASDTPIVNRTSKIVNLRADQSAIARQPTRNPHSSASPSNLAYVIYTSGSTGVPKGVAIAHQSAVAFLNWAHEQYDPDELAGVLAATSICFDLSIFELFAPLSWGGRVILAQNALQLPTLPAADTITLINTVPSTIAELLRMACIPASVRTINLAGEPLPAALVQQLYQMPTIRRVYNLYGPSEDTTYSTVVAALPKEHDAPPPIGRPIADTQIYLLDRSLHPVPIGVPGELYIGGAGQARGYLNRPELTAERFVPNPFATTKDERRMTNDEDSHRSFVLRPSSFVRLYKTGDLARWLQGGMIEFLGRRDQQIKLRGYRMELGEIEATLARHPSVRDVVVVARAGATSPDGYTDKQLVAYVVLATEDREAKLDDRLAQTPASLAASRYSLASVLRLFLSTRLPSYMVPAVFVSLDALPLTSSGKVDRQALPAPERVQSVRSAAIVAPRDTLELQLVWLWEDVLGVRPIGVVDNFFDLGGHSLLAVRLMARLRELTGVVLPLATLFRHPTVEQLARVLRDQVAPTAPSALVAITTGGGNPPLFCIHPLGGNVLCYAQLARRLGPEQPVYGLQSPGLEQDQALPTNVEIIAAEYVATIRMVQPTGPYLLCGWSVGGVIAFEIARQLRAQGQALALLALLDSYVPQPLGARLPDDRLLLIGMARQLGVRLEEAALQPLDSEQQLAYVLEQTQQSDAMLPGLDLAQFGRLFAVYKANAQALLGYTPRPYPGPVTLFRAQEAPQGQDPIAGWEVLARGGVELCDVPGAHETMLREPQVRVLAERLTEAIAQAQAQSVVVAAG